ncbi:hypothetical protein Tco_0953392 [Tanacetum coccineum]|uniref:Uncharacterized protein n=1 Tax=Tanacetum coccineum TaxID=301880 RepID=A0ABQ5E0H0_9ASTR
MDITITLSPITPLDVQFNTSSPSPPIFGHPIPWNLLEAHGDLFYWFIFKPVLIPWLLVGDLCSWGLFPGGFTRWSSRSIVRVVSVALAWSAFAVSSKCLDGGGKGLTKTSLIIHLWDRHCNSEAQAITKHYLLNDLVAFDRAEDGFTLSLLDSLFSKGLRTVKSIPPKCRLGFSRVLKGALDNLVRETLAESSPLMLDLDEGDLDLSKRNLKQYKRKICDGYYIVVVRVLSSSGVAPYNNVTLQELKAKHPFKSAPSLLDTPIDHPHLISSQDVVLDRVKSFPQGTSCGRDGLRDQHLMDCLSGAVVAISDELISSITQVVNLFLAGKCPMMLGEYIASAPLMPLVKPGGGIGLIAVGTIWRCLVSKVSAFMIGHSLDGYLDDQSLVLGSLEVVRLYSMPKSTCIALLSLVGWNSVILALPYYTTENTPYGLVRRLDISMTALLLEIPWL